MAYRPRPQVETAVERVLHDVVNWPRVSVHLESSDAASIRVGPRIVATIGLRSAAVRVFAPSDTLDALLTMFPTARRQHDGIEFRLNAASGDEVLAAIRRRVTVERYADQYREQSP